MTLFPEKDWLDEFESQKGYKILLDYHPDNFEQCKKMKYKLNNF